MFGDFFGEYLLRQEVITDMQLEEAVRYQEEHVSLIGSLAVDMGYMTPLQVNCIFKGQRRDRRMFIQLAVEKGYISTIMCSVKSYNGWGIWYSQKRFVVNCRSSPGSR